ncbi:GNAT family N-acetyltransferase [Paenibacillus sp. D2_2]|uniref:GNAT family N-acetyltransferase n=1 Tax=Paenibacillus sp. D2_2 TaxID=3073092 RepID=UPI0028159977|nr:GNAT family N-acetyltransferase [Paenibacillus sp. D2_2]WMT42375.1 GNAT family N-acetyltransferase [Paenibacillus sp. D2_2]
MKFQLRPLHENDIKYACQLLRSYMPEQVFKQTIFACTGYPAYLQAACKCGAHSSTLLIGAYSGDLLIGFAEWRRLEGMLVLNNLNVDIVYRKDGIGRQLMAYGEELARKEGIGKLALDVFSWNEHAHAWYLRLGFSEMGRTYWYEGDLVQSQAVSEDVTEALSHNDDKDELAYVIDDYPMAEAHHIKYGFSSFRIRTKQHASVVGRLGQQYFRIQLQSGEWDGGNHLTDVLIDLDPERKLLLLSPDAFLRERDPG